jgi:N-acetylglutamate synthase
MITVRPMTMADYEDVIELWKATDGIHLSRSDSREAIAFYLERNPEMSFVARTEDGKLAGAALCGHDGRRGYLHHMAVRTDCRGMGIGRQLSEHCMAALRAVGINKCHLFVVRRNVSGKAFWQQTGWAERTDIIIMSKELAG